MIEVPQSIHPIILLNTSIMTVPGTYTSCITTPEICRTLISWNNCQSHIGHASTAAVLTELLGFPVEVNREYHQQQVGQMAMILKLRGRAGDANQERTAEEIISRGYDLWLMVRTA